MRYLRRHSQTDDLDGYAKRFFDYIRFVVEIQGRSRKIRDERMSSYIDSPARILYGRDPGRAINITGHPSGSAARRFGVVRDGHAFVLRKGTLIRQRPAFRNHTHIT